MLKKFMITAAVGASVFGIAAASASSLGVSGENRNSPFARGVAQQSAAIDATCNRVASGPDKGKALSVEPVLQIASGVQGSQVTGVTIRQQSVSELCNGTQMQVVLTTGSGTFYSAIKNLQATGDDFTLAMESGKGPKASEVLTTTVTIADEIKGLASTSRAN